MRLRLVSILVAIVPVSSWDGAGCAETTRTMHELIGPVRSVTIKHLGYSATETYDRTGRLVETVIDGTQANTARYSLFRYDHDGHLQEELALDPSGRLIYRKRVVYARDSGGRDTASVTTSDDGGFHHAEFSQYDQRGHLWEQLWVNNSIAYKSLFDILGRRVYSARYTKGELFSELKHQYDEQGKLHELVVYNARGIVTSRVIYGYDDMGKRARAMTETLDEDQQCKWITTYEYDELGNWIKELTTEQSKKAPASAVPIVQEREIQYYNLAENQAQ